MTKRKASSGRASSGTLAVVALMLLALTVSALSRGTARALGEGVSIGSSTQQVGATGSVILRALKVDVPPLGAWQVDISYKPAILTAVECTPREGSGVCNLEYAKDKVRLVGVAVDGIRGETLDLAAIRFTCDADGTSPLTLEVTTFADTNGFQMLPAIENGQIECLGPSPSETLATEPATPTASSAKGGSSGGGWPVLAVPAIVGVGLGLLIVGGLSFRYLSGRRRE